MDDALRVLAPDFSVTILVYVATEQAIGHVTRMLGAAGIDWAFEVVQPLPANLRVDDEQLARICAAHFDPILIDRSKRRRPVPLGYADCALPVVLQHNTPNNSIGVLWADTTDRDPKRSLLRRALFPRYERHRVDRL